MNLLKSFYNATAIDGDISGSCRNFLDSLKYRHNAIALFTVAKNIAMALNRPYEVQYSFLSESLAEEYESSYSTSDFTSLNFTIGELNKNDIESISKMPSIKRNVVYLEVYENTIISIRLPKE